MAVGDAPHPNENHGVCQHNNGTYEHPDVDVTSSGEILEKITILCSGCNSIVGYR